MKAIQTIFFWMPVIAATCLACSKNDISPLQKMEINLVVLNEDGEKSNVLEAGADFFVGLEFVNNSTDTILFSRSDYMRLFTQFHDRDDFLLVFEITSEGMVPVGKPYDPDLGLNFTLNYVDPVKISPKQSRAFFGFNWSYNQESLPLSNGRYHSSFKDKAVIENVEIDINTAIEFTIN